MSEHLLLEIEPYPRAVGAEFCQGNIFSTTKVKNKFNPFERLMKQQTKEKKTESEITLELLLLFLAH